jgi:hypothetical protein
MVSFISWALHDPRLEPAVHVGPPKEDLFPNARMGQSLDLDEFMKRPMGDLKIVHHLLSRQDLTFLDDAVWLRLRFPHGNGSNHTKKETPLTNGFALDYHRRQ